MRWLRGLRSDRDSRRVPLAEPLEPRLLYSADLSAGLLLASGTGQAAAPEVRTLTTTGEYAAASTATSLQAASAAHAYVSASLAFEANAGQAPAGVDFSAYGSGYGIALDGGRAALTLVTAGGPQTVTLQLQGAAATPQGEGEGLLAARSNVIVGGDPSQWASGLENYASVIYRGVYDGVDLRYYGNQRQLEYDFIVAPGADAAQVALRFDGVAAASVADNGDLVLQVAGTGQEVRFRAPVSFQRAADGTLEAVASRYAVRADGSVGFVLGDYDHSRELVIDPVLDYATYFGTAGTEDAPAVAVDAGGNVYITGRTNSNAPPLGGAVGGGSGAGDIFVAKFSPDLSTLLFSTRIGGSADEQGNAITLDAAGNIIVTGWSSSGDFPMQGANDASRSGTQDAVLFKLNASGNLVFSTYIGGSGGTDEGRAVAVDASGSIYVTGQTTSSGLLDPVLALLLGSSDNAFVEKYSAGGTLLYHKELGGGSVDLGTGIAVGASGDAFVVGNTQSSNMATTGAEQTALRGAIDGFLAHLDASGNTLYQTYVGGTDADTATGVATDGTGKAYVVGVTRGRASVVFTTTPGAYQSSALISNGNTGFLRVYDTAATGTASLQYSTYIGGSNPDLPSGVALYGGDVVVVGRASSTTDFPITPDAAQSANSGAALYLVMIQPAGAGAADLRYGTFYAGGFVTTGNAAVHGNRVYAVGQITDSNWATTGAYNTVRQGNDAFIAAFTLPNTAPVLSGLVQPAPIAEDSVSNSGFLVASLVAGKIADADPGAIQGIAVVASDTSHGSWEYTLDGSTWQALAAPSAGNALLLAADAQTRIRFVPAADYNGTVAAGLSVRAWDRTTGMAGGRADAGITGGSSAFSTASFAVDLTVTPVNDAPVVGGPVTLPALAEDGTATLTKAQLLATAGDVDGDTLSVLNLVANAGTLVDNGNGTWSFTPAANANGTVSFTYAVSDATVSVPASASIVVTPVNDAPVAGGDSVVATRNTPLTIAAATLLGNDADVENSALAIASVASGSSGTAVLNADGSVTFTPQASYSGPASFTYTVSDGALASAPATVNVTVNTLPVAAADTAAATEDTAATYAAATLIANDSDADAGDVLSIASVASGAGGSAVLNADGSVTFTPDANFNGPATFSYRLTDGKGLSAPATVTVNVAAVNDAPVANPDSFTTAEDNALVINLSDLLGNDTDAEGSPLSVVSVANGTGGTVVLNGNGTVRFTPTANFNGTATFTYVVSDGSASSAPGTVSVTVTPVNDAPVANDDSGVTNEDTPITFTAAQLLGNDTDAEGNPLTIASVSGTGAVLNADGSVTFTPSADFNGTTSFNYRVSDGTSTSGNGKVTVVVNPVNDAPVAVADTLAAVSNTPVTYTAAQLLGNDTDVDGDPLTIGSVTGGSGGTVVLNADGTVTFTPTAGFAGTATFTYTARDASLSSAPATVTVRVNDVPVAAADAVAATEDTPATYAASALLGNDSDLVGSPLAIAGVANGTGGTVVLNADGTVTFTPFADFNGAGSFTYTVTDGSLVSAPATVTVNVAPVNDAPANSGPVALAPVAEDGGPVTITQAQLLQNASDVDGDTLAVLNLVASTGTLVANGNGTWSFTPGANYNGTVSFTYGISDGTATTPGSASLVVSPVNDAPTTSNVSLPSMAEDGGSVTITSAQLLQNASDVENDALAVVNLAAGNGTLVDNGNGTWSFTPGANYNGTVALTYGITDGLAITAATASLVVTPVNDAPATTPVALPAMPEDGGPVTITQAQLLQNASDVDGNALVVLNLAADSGTLVANGNGTWTFTPAGNYNGTVAFTYDVSDGSASATATASLPVTPMNDAPATSTVSLPPMAEDGGSVTITAAQLLQNASDVDGDALAVLNLAASTGTLVASGPGSWTFTPGANFNGAVTFTYDVSDGTASTPGSAALVVSPSNDLPTTAAVTLPPVAEDGGPVTLTQVQLLANAGDIDGDALSVRNLAASNGTLVANAGGTWTFTPAGNYNGTVAFTYEVFDGTATTAGAATLQVTPVNDAPATLPVALPPVAEDSGAVLITSAQLLANASDIEGDPLSVTNLAASTGTLVDNGNGTWSFTPGANFNGTVSFSYGVSDGMAATAASATLDVTPANDAPTTAAVNLPGMQEDGGTVLITAADLLANAADADGDVLSVANLSASGGTLVANGNGTWSFTPAANANGSVVFTYTVTDGTATAAGTATLQVAPVNDAPATSPVTLPATAEDSGAVTITAAQLLANAGDVEGDPLSVSGLSASSGTLVANGNGTWTFTPARDFEGTVTFSYAVSDGTDATAAAASLLVTGVDDAPQVTSDGGQPSAAVTVAENTLAVTTVTAGDVDTPARNLVFSIAGGADAARFTIDAATGALAFVRSPDFETPADANQDNVYDVVVRVSDGSLAGQQVLAVRVTDAADAGPMPAAPPAQAPAPAAAPAPGASEPLASLVPAPAPAGPAPAPAPSDTRGVRTSDSLQEALGPGMPAPIATLNSTPVSFASAPARILLDADTSRVLRTVVFDRGGFELISTDPDAQLVLGRFGIDSRPEAGRLDEVQRTLRSAALANQLDRLRESVREELDLDKSVTISVASVSLGLSLVYVLWLIRGGVLLGSYLSALPAWRLLDPLPVLSRVDDEEDGKDDEEPLDGGRRDGRDTLRGFG